MVGNYREGDSAYPHEDIESDEDELLSVMKRRNAPKAQDDDDTPAENTPSSQELRESGWATPQPK